jgi:hypothetical protein
VYETELIDRSGKGEGAETIYLQLNEMAFLWQQFELLGAYTGHSITSAHWPVLAVQLAQKYMS